MFSEASCHRWRKNYRTDANTVSVTLQITEDKVLPDSTMRKWHSIFNPSIYLIIPDKKKEKDLSFIREDIFTTTASTQELLSRLLLIVIMSGQPVFHLSNIEVSWQRGRTGSNTNFSHLQEKWWPPTELGCQSPQKGLLQPQKLSRYQEQLLFSTLRDFLRRDLLKALSMCNTSQRRRSGSLQEMNALALLIDLLLFGRT